MELFHSTATLRDSMDTLTHAIDNVIEYIKSIPNPYALAFQLPDTKPHEEHDPIEQIPVTPITGSDALSLVCDAFKQFYARTDISSKATYRLPGVIVLPTTHAPEISRLVALVNQEKTTFQEHVQKLGDRDTKFEIVHQALPGLITLQVYRKLTLILEPLKSLGFTWANKQSIVKLKRDTALEILEKSKKNPPLTTPCEQWEIQVDREINSILTLPQSAQLRQKRPVKTHPILNVRTQEAIQQQYKASLPVIICQDTLPRIKPLRDYPPKQRLSRDDKQQAQELVPRLRWYRLT